MLSKYNIRPYSWEEYKIWYNRGVRRFLWQNSIHATVSPGPVFSRFVKQDLLLYYTNTESSISSNFWNWLFLFWNWFRAVKGHKVVNNSRQLQNLFDKILIVCEMKLYFFRIFLIQFCMFRIGLPPLCFRQGIAWLRMF